MGSQIKSLASAENKLTANETHDNAADEVLC